MYFFISEEIKNSICDYIKLDIKKKTPSDIELFITETFFTTKKEAKKYIKQLILSGDLEYINQFGRSFIDLSFNKPVRISDNVVLKPHDKTYFQKETDIVVSLSRGLSFGIGSHPTTRMSIKGIDELFRNKEKSTFSDKTALDIGTGSGVLAITAALYGVGSVKACDIDKVAIDESTKNSKLNKVDKIVTVSNSVDSTLSYNYIFANLRYPTLVDLYPLFLKITAPNSYLVFSGIKIEEREIIIKQYSNLNFFIKTWEENELGWVGMAFRRNNAVF